MTMSNPTTLRNAALAAMLMIASSAVTVWLAQRVAPYRVKTAALEQIVPQAFADWQAEDNRTSTIVSPNVEQIINTIYSDTLSRTYVNKAGQRVMLSLAYGENQNRDLQVHKPEVCYVAQGFQLKASNKVELHTSLGAVPSMQLVTTLGPRSEPVTYWIRVGDRVVRGWAEQNLARAALGLEGKLPDGMLVRASTIDSNTPAAFAVQERFLSDMLAAIPSQHRAAFVGTRAL